MTAPRYDVVSLGEPMVEFNQVPGEPHRYLQGFGGDTMNAVIAAARQGARTAYLTRLGDDQFGRWLRELWQAEGVDGSFAETEAGGSTAVYFVTHGPQGHAFSYRRTGSAASHLSPANLPLDPIRSTRLLHTSGITQAISDSACDAALAAIEAARAAGAQVVYDSNLRTRLWPLARARAVISATAAMSDFFLPSLEDASALSGSTSAEANLDWALRLGAPRVALKLGADGLLASDGTRSLRLAGHCIDCRDATGAGDCFAGSLMARIAAGDDFHAALRYANAAAALTCTGFGAVAPIPRPDAVHALLAS